MSAIPKKKLCWNCDGNVSKDINNCPYCGVYLHGDEPAQQSFWGMSYTKTKEEDEQAEGSDIPLAPYQAIHERTIEENLMSEKEEKQPLVLMTGLRKDLIPMLTLMSGSIFFLFGIVLFFFSQNGKLTLQWDGDNWIYFLGASIPLFYCGWQYLNKDST